MGNRHSDAKGTRVPEALGDTGTDRVPAAPGGAWPSDVGFGERVHTARAVRRWGLSPQSPGKWGIIHPEFPKSGVCSPQKARSTDSGDGERGSGSSTQTPISRRVGRRLPRCSGTGVQLPQMFGGTVSADEGAQTARTKHDRGTPRLSPENGRRVPEPAEDGGAQACRLPGSTWAGGRRWGQHTGRTCAVSARPTFHASTPRLSGPAFTPRSSLRHPRPPHRKPGREPRPQVAAGCGAGRGPPALWLSLLTGSLRRRLAPGRPCPGTGTKALHSRWAPLQSPQCGGPGAAPAHPPPPEPGACVPSRPSAPAGLRPAPELCQAPRVPVLSAASSRLHLWVGPGGRPGPCPRGHLPRDRRAPPCRMSPARLVTSVGTRTCTRPPAVPPEQPQSLLPDWPYRWPWCDGLPVKH